MANLLCKVNFSFPLQLHFFPLFHNANELTINTFSHCLLRRVYLFAVFFFFDYQPFPPSPLLLTPAALVGQFMLQSLTNITASHQGHRAAGEPCSIHVLWEKAGVFPGMLHALAAVFSPGTRSVEAPLKRTHSHGAKKTRTVQRSEK